MVDGGRTVAHMYVYGDLCSFFHYVMPIFLNSVESELIYAENKGCHWLKVCDRFDEKIETYLWSFLDNVDDKHYRNLQMRKVSVHLKIGSVTVNIFCHLTGDRRSQEQIDTTTRGRNS